MCQGKHNEARKCKFCGYTSMCSGHLKFHERMHLGDKQYKCSECNFSSVNRKALLIHAKEHLVGHKRFKCQYCPYECNFRDHLSRHEMTHTGVKPYKCQTCPYSAISAQQVRFHETKHTGEKKHKCNLCPFRTAHLHTIERHLRTHTGEKPYSCQYCSYSAKYQARVSYHEIKHHTASSQHPYICPQCPSTFLTNANRVRHLRHHEGKRRYKCPHCTYSISCKIRFIAHLSCHGDSLPSKVRKAAAPPICVRSPAAVQSRYSLRSQGKYGCQACKFVSRESKLLAIHYANQHSLPLVCITKLKTKEESLHLAYSNN